MQKKSLIVSLVTNVALLLTGFAVAFSGFLIQLDYHMGHHGSIDENDLVLGMDYLGWTNGHKVSIVTLSLLVIIHIILHWRWYKTVLQKNLFAKNKLAIALTMIFTVVAITGYVPWLIGLTGGSDASRRTFIEVHDKIAVVLFVCLVIHLAKRFRWFIDSIHRLNKPR
jgi:hypothetical protein